MNLLTRKQIIKEWSKQSEKHLNSFCCPNFRNLLVSVKDNILECINDNCEHEDKYSLKGEVLPKNTVLMISGNPYGRSPVMEILKNTLSNHPIIPVSAGEVDLDYKAKRGPSIESFLMPYGDAMAFHKLQNHIDNLKSERDKLPEYAQESLDVILNVTVFGVDVAQGPDVYVESVVMGGRNIGKTETINRHIENERKNGKQVVDLRVLPFENKDNINE